MLNHQKLIVSLAVTLFAVSANADSFAYVVTDSQQFGTVDLNSGAFRQIGSDTPEQQFNLVAGPNGSLLSLTASGNLEAINTATGGTTIIGPTGLGFSWWSLVRHRRQQQPLQRECYDRGDTTDRADRHSADSFQPSYCERRESIWGGRKVVRDI